MDRRRKSRCRSSPDPLVGTWHALEHVLRYCLDPGGAHLLPGPALFLVGLPLWRRGHFELDQGFGFFVSQPENYTIVGGIAGQRVLFISGKRPHLRRGGERERVGLGGLALSEQAHGPVECRNVPYPSVV